MKNCLNWSRDQNKCVQNILEMTKSEAETLLSKDLILRIIESEDITVEVEKETDEELAKGRFF